MKPQIKINMLIQKLWKGTKPLEHKEQERQNNMEIYLNRDIKAQLNVGTESQTHKHNRNIKRKYRQKSDMGETERREMGHRKRMC